MTPRPPKSTLFPYTTLFRSNVLEQGIGFANELHIAVLDAVVDHLDVVAGAVRADVRAASGETAIRRERDRKSTRLNSSHEWISYAVFCLKKKKKKKKDESRRKKKKIIKKKDQQKTILQIRKRYKKYTQEQHENEHT